LLNGLSDEENDELGAITDARRAVDLVLAGLQAVHPDAGAGVVESPPETW
jgi:hypothetical protein